MVGCALHPNSDFQCYGNHCDKVESICARYQITKLLLVGDYNLPHYSCSKVNIREMRD